MRVNDLNNEKSNKNAIYFGLSLQDEYLMYIVYRIPSHNGKKKKVEYIKCVP